MNQGIVRAVGLAAAVAAAAVGVTPSFAADVSKPFVGKAVNGGTVSHEERGGRHVLTLSADFQVPGSPDPHWQIVDTKGNVYLLNRLTIKDDKVNRSITVPAYIADIASVQMWCAWAEVLLGETTFAKPIVAHVAR